jgi:hypothetical protein
MGGSQLKLNPMESSNCLLRLQKWYTTQCNGDWEYRFGIRIDTIDNPGWSIRIDLTDTKLENEKWEDVRIDISEDNWILCWVNDKTFQGGGAPQNLIDLINIFLGWTEKISSKQQNSQGNNAFLLKLQDWYKAQCDGDWEHEFGIKIETLDNPGWSLRIDLAGTSIERKPFRELRQNIAKNNWIQCWIGENKFQGTGGSSNLIDLVKIFIEWASN